MSQQSIIALDRNEYYFHHHPDILNSLKNSKEEVFSRYADQESMAFLRAHLGSSLSVEPAKITLSHGAEDAFVKIFAWFKMTFNNLVIEDFSWTNYLHIANGFNYNIKRIETLVSSEGFYFNTDGFKDYLKEASPSLILLTCPNNPTGHSISFEELNFLITQFPQHIFLLDYVYAPFFESKVLSLSLYENVIIVGSFSKFFGLPGLRIGFAIGNLPEAFQLNLGLQPFVLTACNAALLNAWWYQNNREFMLSYAKELLTRDYSKIKIFKTEAPFFLLQLNIEESQIQASLSEAENSSGVRPKYINRKPAHYLRFSLGPKEICNKIDTYLSFFK